MNRRNGRNVSRPIVKIIIPSSIVSAAPCLPVAEHPKRARWKMDFSDYIMISIAILTLLVAVMTYQVAKHTDEYGATENDQFKQIHQIVDIQRRQDSEIRNLISLNNKAAEINNHLTNQVDYLRQTATRWLHDSALAVAHDSSYINWILRGISGTYAWLTYDQSRYTRFPRNERDTILPIIESDIKTLANEQRINVFLRTHAPAANLVNAVISKLAEFSWGLKSTYSYVGSLKAFVHLSHNIPGFIPKDAVECRREAEYIANLHASED